MRFRPIADVLESRMLLSFGGGNIDPAIPRVSNASPGMNFTSNTFHQVNDSIDNLAAAIAKNPSGANAQLANFVSKLPLGKTSLLPALQADVALFQSGGATLTAAQANSLLTTLHEDLLQREPTAAEITAGTQGLQAGVTTAQVVDILVQSNEFLMDNVTVGASIPDNQVQFVSALYEEVLGRAADIGGLTYWLNQMNYAGQSTQQVAHAIVASAEATTSPSSVLHAPARDSIETVYLLLDRNPSPAELAAGVQVLETGYASVAQVADLLVQSNEFLQSNVVPGNSIPEDQADFVGSLYRGVLGREADLGGLTYWLNQMNYAGQSTQQVAHAIVTSAEAATSTTSILQRAAYTSPVAKYYFGTVTPNGPITGNFAGTGTTAQLENLIQRDVLAYLANGIGTQFNILKSGVNYASDKLLTYNGHV